MPAMKVPEVQDRDRCCDARGSRGIRCPHPTGWGTDPVGVGRCNAAWPLGKSVPLPVVHAWLRWLNRIEGISGIAAFTPEERLKAATAEAATGKSPATVWLDVRQAVWAEEGPWA
jgi:hypothetical protein